MSGEACNQENAVLFSRVSTLESVVDEVKDAVKSIDQSLRILAALEVEHKETRSALTRAFDEIKDHETRIRVVEAEMPTLKLTRGWTLTAVAGIVALVGLAVWKLI